MVFGFLASLAKPLIGALGGGLLSPIVKPIIEVGKNLIGGLFGGRGGGGGGGQQQQQQPAQQTTPEQQKYIESKGTGLGYNSMEREGVTGVAPWLNAQNPYVARNPFGQIVRSIGPTFMNWIGSEPFMGAMRQFGNTVGNRLGFTKLMPYTMGNNLGDVYYKGMRRVFDYIRNPQETEAQMTGGTGDKPVERMVDVVPGQQSKPGYGQVPEDYY